MTLFAEQDRSTVVDPNFLPRWYQEEAVKAMFTYFYDGGKGNPLIVVPTGAGKSHIIAMFCKQVLDKWSDQRLLILTHVDTIIRQDYLTLRKHLTPNLVGIYSAGVGRKERKAVTVAGIQSISTKSELFQGTTLILVDECHRIPAKGVGQYRSFISKFKVPIIGLTASHFRLGTGYKFSKKVIVSVEAEKDIETPVRIRFGTEYELIENLYLRAGMSTKPAEYSFGLGYNFKNVCLDLAFKNHQSLGFYSHIGLSYLFQRNDK